MRIWIIFVMLAVLVALAFEFPRYTAEDDAAMYKKYQRIRYDFSKNSQNSQNLQNLESSQNSQKISRDFVVMSMNTRVISKEDTDDNDFMKRLPRIINVLNKWEPSVIGFQELYEREVDFLTGALPQKYKLIAKAPMNAGGVGIAYNTEILSLQENDYLYTPKIHSKGLSHFNNYGELSLNIARFKLREKNGEKEKDIIMFNTHLNRWSEETRREQTIKISETIQKWRERFPEALVFLTGDMNSIPGQVSYKTLTANLQDSWVVCNNKSNNDNENDKCVISSMASTYHAWLGSKVNSWAMRIIQAIGFTLHGMGLSPPVGNVTFSYVINEFIYNHYPLSEALPDTPLTRLHVDWILYGSKDIDKIEPLFHSVVDVRTSLYSSDHFPVLSLFRIKE